MATITSSCRGVRFIGTPYKNLSRAYSCGSAIVRVKHYPNRLPGSSEKRQVLDLKHGGTEYTENPVLVTGNQPLTRLSGPSRWPPCLRVSNKKRSRAR